MGPVRSRPICPASGFRGTRACALGPGHGGRHRSDAIRLAVETLSWRYAQPLEAHHPRGQAHDSVGEQVAYAGARRRPSRRLYNGSASRSPRRRRELAALEDCECKEGMFALAATPAATVRRRGARRRGRNDRDAAARCRRQGAAWRGRISGAGRSHQRAGPHDGGGRRLRLALAVRDRGALGKSAPRPPHFRRCRTATAPSRRPACTTSVITAASRTSIPPGTA